MKRREFLSIATAAAAVTPVQVLASAGGTWAYNTAPTRGLN